MLKARMAKSALLHFDGFEIYSGTLLEAAGLVTKGEPQKSPDAYMRGVLLDQSHPKRVSHQPGPTLFYQDATDQTRQYAIDMRGLLLEEDTEFRAAAWSHFVQLGQLPSPAISPRTLDSLNAQKMELLSEDRKEWQAAALALYPLIENDLLCTLAGVRQSIAERYEDGLASYVPKLLRPQITALEGLQLPYMKPSEQKEKMREDLSSIAARESLPGAFEIYLDRLGTLPLNSPLGMSDFVHRWTRSHEHQSNELGDQLWDCSKDNHVGQGMLCLWFLADPNQFKKTHPSDLARVMLRILRFGTRSERDEDLFWGLANELSRHYLRHFLLTAPTGLGEPFATGAWWLALRAAAIFVENPQAGIHLRDVAVFPQSGTSDLAWGFANVVGFPSRSSTATLWSPSPWQLAVIGGITPESARVLRSTLTEDERRQLGTNLTHQLLFWSPTDQEDKGSTHTYAFEIPIRDKLEIWKAVIPPEQGDFLSAIASVYDELSNVDAFARRLKDVSAATEADQLIVANSARLMALQDRLPLDEVWNLLIDASWRNAIFEKLPTPALEMLFLAFAYSLRRGGDKWMSTLPHLYAETCEYLKEGKRIELLFAFVVLSCLHSYSVSALVKLLLGSKRSAMLDLGRQWKARLLDASRDSPPWITARMRAITAAISASS
jgi:hypothetical protein